MMYQTGDEHTSCDNYGSEYYVIMLSTLVFSFVPPPAHSSSLPPGS